MSSITATQLKENTMSIPITPPHFHKQFQTEKQQQLCNLRKLDHVDHQHRPILAVVPTSLLASPSHLNSSDMSPTASTSLIVSPSRLNSSDISPTVSRYSSSPKNLSPSSPGEFIFTPSFFQGVLSQDSASLWPELKKEGEMGPMIMLPTSNNSRALQQYTAQVRKKFKFMYEYNIILALSFILNKYS